MKKAIRIEGGHFWLNFKNGYTLSVFNGFGSHTENWDALDKFKEISDERKWYLNFWESDEVEIAIIRDGELVTQNIINSDDSVKTIKINELIDIINIINNLEDITDILKGEE